MPAIMKERAAKTLTPQPPYKAKRPRVTRLMFEYKPTAQIAAKYYDQFGGYCHESGTMTPLHGIKRAQSSFGSEAIFFFLDSIAAAHEAGWFEKESEFLEVCFQTRKDAALFASLIEDYQYWTNDRHFHVFFAMSSDEERASTYQAIAGYVTEILERVD